MNVHEENSIFIVCVTVVIIAVVITCGSVIETATESGWTDPGESQCEVE